MKALLLTDYKRLEVTEVDEPQMGPEDVLIQVEACGICGSDIHGYDGSTGRRIPPLIMGHEAAGIVVSVGADVDDLMPGDRVTFDSMVSCGRCEFCRAGHQNLCNHRRVLGVSCGEYRRHGAFAERIAVPRRIVYLLPEGMPFEHAALVEAVSVGVHAVNVSPIQLGDTVVMVGAGMIGLLTLQAAKAAGATRVIAVDINDKRLSVAAELGATDTLRSDQCDVPQAIRELTGGRGVDNVIELGGPGTLPKSLACTRVSGRVSLIGVLTGVEGDSNPLPALFNRLTIQGIYVGSRAMFADMNRAIAANGLEPVMDRVFDFADAQEAYRYLKSGDHFGKVVIKIAD